MKIGFLGAGTWGYCLASLLASKGFEVVSWTRDAQLAAHLQTHRRHPRLKAEKAPPQLRFTSEIAEVLDGVQVLIESVTSKGIRPVFEQVFTYGTPRCPIVITSKGIEQNSGLILPEVIVEVFGSDIRLQVGALSGPGYAQEVIDGLPTSLVGTAYSQTVMLALCDLFTTQTFRVYPNGDVAGVAFGGALKNVIAIACGISDGLGYGNGAKAALMTRGLHEIRKLGLALGCKIDTFYGLSGMGDIFLTCGSLMSRNYRFGHLLAQGRSVAEARTEIGMVVEGAYTCVSALQLSQQTQIPMPITEQVHRILFEGLAPAAAVKALMQRVIKEEHL